MKAILFHNLYLDSKISRDLQPKRIALPFVLSLVYSILFVGGYNYIWSVSSEMGLLHFFFLTFFGMGLLISWTISFCPEECDPNLPKIVALKKYFTRYLYLIR